MGSSGPNARAAPIGLAAFAWMAVGAAPSLSARARADVVRPAPPPSACPPGAIGESGHAGPYCRPTECQTAEDCDWPLLRHRAPRYECAPAGLCVLRRPLHVGRGRTWTIPVAVAACDEDADCPLGADCEFADRCHVVGEPGDPDADPPLPRGVAPPGQGSCDRRGGPVVFCLALVVLVGAGALARRASRRRALARAAARLGSGAPLAHAELVATAGGERLAAQALGAVADRLRVDVDDDGALVYRLDEDGAARAAAHSRK